MLSQNLAFSRDLTTVNTAPFPPPLSHSPFKAAFCLGYRPLGSLFIRSSLFHEKERRSGFPSDARLHLFSVHSLSANIRSFKSRTHAAYQEPRGGRELLDHRRECIQHPNSDCQTRRDSIYLSLSFFCTSPNSTSNMYRTDGGSAAQAQLARTLSSLVRIETELMNRAQAAAAAVGAGAEGEGERGGGGDV